MLLETDWNDSFIITLHSFLFSFMLVCVYMIILDRDVVAFGPQDRTGWNGIRSTILTSASFSSLVVQNKKQNDFSIIMVTYHFSEVSSQ